MKELDHFTYMCRLCLTRSPSNIDIFGEEGVKNDLQSKIQRLFTLLVKPEEILPRSICAECLKNLNFIDTFRLNVENAQSTILSMMKELVEDQRLHNAQSSIEIENTGGSNAVLCLNKTPIDVNLETSEAALNEGDLERTNKPYDGIIKKEETEEDILSERDYREDSDCEEDGNFLAADHVMEFVEVDDIDEPYSPAESNEEISGSADSSHKEAKKSKKRRVKKSRKKFTDKEDTSRSDHNLLGKKTAKQSTWTSSMAEEVQKFYQFTCELCSGSQTYETFGALCKHFRSVHDTEGYFKCCKRKIYCRSHLYQHMILHTRPEMYKCPKCDKQLCGPVNLKQHLQLFHLPQTELPYRCSVCGRGFATRSVVENHEKMQHFLSHEEKFVHGCDICEKRFTSVAGLAEHKKQVHSQFRPLLCDICAKAFPNPSRLRKHLTTHSDSENIKCPHCDQRLKNFGRLKVHMKRHQGVVHACDQCDKTYPTRRLLQRHSKTHSDDRPHECTICGKRYRESSHLKMHFNQHTGALPYRCQWCPKRFSASGPFYTHRKKIHPEEWARANEIA